MCIAQALLIYFPSAPLPHDAASAFGDMQPAGVDEVVATGYVEALPFGCRLRFKFTAEAMQNEAQGQMAIRSPTDVPYMTPHASAP